MKVIVNISLKEGVLDPEGQAIKSSLRDMFTITFMINLFILLFWV